MATAIGDLVARLNVDRHTWAKNLTLAQRDIIKFSASSTARLSLFSGSVIKANAGVMAFRANTATMFGPFASSVAAAGRAIVKFESLVVGAMRAAKAAVLALTATFAPLIGAFALLGTLRTGEMFNQKMRQSLAIMGDVSAMMKGKMREAALAVAKSTKFAASEAAEAFYFLASASLNVKQSLAALPQVALFAQAGMFDISRATELATDAQSALGMKVKNAAQNLVNLTRVTDVLTAANTMADATTEQFAEAITGKAGPALRNVKKSIEEGVAVLAVFADQGLKGEEASTRLAMVLRDLRIKAVKNADAFRDMNIEVFRAGKMRHVADIMGDIENSLGNLNDKARTAALLQLGFTFKSLSGIELLMGHSAKIRDHYEELLGVMGRTKEVADEQLTSFQKGWMKLSASLTEVGNLIMKVVGPAIHWLGILMDGIVSGTKYTLFGIEPAEWSKYADNIGDVGDAVGGMDSAMDNAAASAENFKQQLLGITREMTALEKEADDWSYKLYKTFERVKFAAMDLTQTGISKNMADMIAQLKLSRKDSFQVMRDNINLGASVMIDPLGTEIAIRPMETLLKKTMALRDAFGSGKIAAAAMFDALGKLQTPAEELAKYKSDLEQLVNFGIIKAVQGQELLNKAYEASPMGKKAADVRREWKATEASLDAVALGIDKLSGKYSKLDIAVFEWRRAHKDATSSQVEEFRELQTKLLAMEEKEALKRQGKKADEAPKALQQGSKEAMNKIISAMRGGGKDKPAERTAANTKRAADAAERTANATEQTAEQEPNTEVSIP